MDKSDKGDYLLSFAPFFQIVVLMLQQILVDANIFVHESIRIVSIITSAIPIVICMVFIIERKLFLFLASYTIVLLLISASAIFFVDNKQYLESEIFYLLCINIPCFLCISSIKEIDILRQTLLVLSFVIFILGFIYYGLVWKGRIIFSGYSMSYSYYLLLPSLVFVSQRKIIFNIAFLITCIMMLMLGSRGALIIAILYAFSLWLIESKKKSILFLFIVIICIGIFSNGALSFLQTIADKSGVSSRTLRLILEGNIAESSSRLAIYSDTWDSILNRPLLGHGVYGDRVVLNGLYCHNIFLEILHNFGLIFGGGLLLILFFFIFSVFQRSDEDNKKMILLFICFGFLPFLVSGSYLNYPEFGVFLGFLYYQNNYIKIISSPTH
jgi:hypothetical protein